MRWTKKKSAKQKYEERMARQRPEWERRCEWHSWFAWHPVAVPDNYTGTRKVWLETIERRFNQYRRQRQPSSWVVIDSSDYEYRFPEG